MTLDDLVKLAQEGRDRLYYHSLKNPINRATATGFEMERAGIRAVVEALRDEMHFDWQNCECCSDNSEVFNEILGSDAVARHPTTGNPLGTDTVAGRHPAADVCEWTKEHNSPGSGWLDCKGNRHWLKSECPCCNRSIRFKETP